MKWLLGWSGWDDPIAVFTGSLNVVTAALAVFTFFLWRSTGELVKKTSDTAKKELRAYVSMEEISLGVIQPTLGFPAMYRVTIIWGNGGKTPTKNLLSNIDWKNFPQELPDDFDFPDNPNIPPTVGLIGPGRTLNSRNVDIPVDLVETQIATKYQHLYIWGWVDYDDVIDGMRRHRTEFCVELLRDGKLTSFRPQGKFNGADDDCRRQPAPYVPA